MKNTKASGTIQICITGFLWGTVGVFCKLINVSAAVVAFTKGIGGSVCVLIFMLIAGIRFDKIALKKHLLMTVAAGIAMGLNWLLIFMSFDYTSVATASLCYYMAPVILTLLSPFFFKEQLTGKRIITVLLSLVGAALVSGIAGDGNAVYANNRLGVILAIGASVFYAALSVMNKFLSNEVPSYDRTVVELFCGGIVMLPYLLFNGQLASTDFSLSKVALLFIVGGGIQAGIAYILYFNSMKYLTSQSVSILSYMDPVVTVILSIMILGEPMTVFSAAGAILIIGSAVVAEI